MPLPLITIPVSPRSSSDGPSVSPAILPMCGADLAPRSFACVSGASVSHSAVAECLNQIRACLSLQSEGAGGARRAHHRRDLARFTVHDAGNLSPGASDGARESEDSYSDWDDAGDGSEGDCVGLMRRQDAPPKGYAAVSGAGRPSAAESSTSSAAHLQVIAELRARLSDVTGAQAGLASDVSRLNTELSERSSLVEAQGKRMGAMAARIESMKGRMEGLLSDRVEDRKVIHDLTQRSLQASAREEAMAADITAWRQFCKVTDACVAAYLEQSGHHLALFAEQQKELLLLRSQARMWPHTRGLLTIAGLIEGERDHLRSAMNTLSEEFGVMQTVHTEAMQCTEAALAVAKDKLHVETQKMLSLEQAVCRQMISIELPSLQMVVAPTPCCQCESHRHNTSVQPVRTDTAEHPNITREGQSKSDVVLTGGFASSDAQRALVSSVSGPSQKPPAALAVEQALRRGLEEQLSTLLASTLGKIEDGVRRIGGLLPPNEEGGASEGGAIGGSGSAAAAASETVTTTAHRLRALEERHARLEGSYAQLQQRTAEEDGQHASIRQDLQDLQHYIAHMETELCATGHAPTRPQGLGVMQQRSTTNVNIANNAGAGGGVAGQQCYMCQQHVPTARSVRCARCAKVYHKSCCGFPKNEANFVCCGQQQQQQAANGRARGRQSAVHH